MVGIPVMFDQHLNMRIAEHKGYGLCVPFEVLSASKIRSAVNEVLQNERFVLLVDSNQNFNSNKTIFFTLRHISVTINKPN